MSWYTSIKRPWTASIHTNEENVTQTAANRKHPFLAFCKTCTNDLLFLFLKPNLACRLRTVHSYCPCAFCFIVSCYILLLWFIAGWRFKNRFHKMTGEWYMLVTNTLLYNVYCGCVLSRAERREGLMFDQAAGIEPDRASAHHETALCLAVWRQIWCNLQGKVAALTESFKLNQCQDFALECTLYALYTRVYLEIVYMMSLKSFHTYSILDRSLLPALYTVWQFSVMHICT